MLYLKKMGDYKNSYKCALFLMIRLDFLKNIKNHLNLNSKIKNLNDFSSDFKNRYKISVKNHNNILNVKTLKRFMSLKNKRENKKKKINFLEFFNNYGIPYNNVRFKCKKKEKKI